MEEDRTIPAAEWDERTRRLLDLLEPLAVAGLYFTSFASWIYGIIFGVVVMAQCKLEANKKVGKICLILAIVNIALIALCVVIYVVVVLFAVAGFAWFAQSGGGG
jgi:hypothetical protein